MGLRVAAPHHTVVLGSAQRTRVVPLGQSLPAPVLWLATLCRSGWFAGWWEQMVSLKYNQGCQGLPLLLAASVRAGCKVAPIHLLQHPALLVSSFPPAPWTLMGSPLTEESLLLSFASFFIRGRIKSFRFCLKLAW